jgi:hypothetical protein
MLHTDRMKAKPIEGEHCRFCGRTSVPLVKTPCCHQWICCDTKFVSINGGGYCQEIHERFTLCYSHFIDGHSSHWKDCQACRDFWSQEEYWEYSNHPLNTPKY